MDYYIPCKVCTFLNENTNDNCKICDAVLEKKVIKTNVLKKVQNYEDVYKAMRSVGIKLSEDRIDEIILKTESEIFDILTCEEDMEMEQVIKFSIVMGYFKGLHNNEHFGTRRQSNEDTLRMEQDLNFTKSLLEDIKKEHQREVIELKNKIIELENTIVEMAPKQLESESEEEEVLNVEQMRQKRLAFFNKTT